MLEQNLLELAIKHGAQSYSEPPMRAVTGLSFTYAQLQQFAEAVTQIERTSFAQHAVNTTRLATDFARLTERDRCCLLVSTLLGDRPETRIINNSIREVQCSSLCHAMEPCSLTEDGRCIAGAKT